MLSRVIKWAYFTWNIQDAALYTFMESNRAKDCQPQKLSKNKVKFCLLVYKKLYNFFLIMLAKSLLKNLI